MPAALALLLTACGGGDEPTAGDDEGTEQTSDTGGDAATEAGPNAVTVKGFVFSPTPVEVTAGTEVTWTNRDETEHTVTSGTPGMPDAKFNQVLAGAGATFAFTFADPGTYPYFCARHTSMTGEVVVT